MMRAWHFVGDKLRNGDTVPPDGEKLVWKGELALCRTGLHASLEPADALQYAPGTTLCMVKCGGKIICATDKLVCSERTILARMDATDMLWYFARMQAVSVVHRWDAPDVVLDYLMTGDEALRPAAHAAARTVAGTAARTVAWAAARSAAWNAARSAAWAAAHDALESAWEAAHAAARTAAQAAALESTLESAHAAAWGAARAEFNSLVYECFGV